MPPQLGAWWQQRDRDSRVALVGITVLLAGAIAVRAWLMIGYGSAFLGFPDSLAYGAATIEGGFTDIQHPAGYSLFLRAADYLSDQMAFTIAVQHALGIATGVLLYKAVRRTGAPPWLGLLPAAVVFFGATGLFLEHSLLADPLLAFLQALALYFSIRALYDARLRWPLLAGLSLGLAFWIKIGAVSNAIVIPILLLCATPGGPRRKLLSAGAAALAVVVVVLAYIGVQYQVTGYLGYVRQSPWALYTRVVTFVDCSKFTPPPETSFLCPPEPPGHRHDQDYYGLDPRAPAVQRLGPGYAPLNPQASKLLREFSIAAIEHQPIDYAKAIAAGLGRYVFPWGGEGEMPSVLRQQLLKKLSAKDYPVIFAPLYPHSHDYTGPASKARVLAEYERYTGVQGPFLIALLVLAIIGPLFLPAGKRGPAAIFTLTALFSITFAIAGLGYDARYAYPTFGPLAAGAALGAWGVRLRLLPILRRTRTIVGAKAVIDDSPVV